MLRFLLQKATKHFNSILFLLGLALLFWLIKKLGAVAILHNLSLLGLNAFWALIPSLFILVAQSYAWQETLRHFDQNISLVHLFMIKNAGEAVNNLSPLSWGGGDPVRIMLLKKWVSPLQATASVVIDRTLTTIALVIFMLIGLILALIYFNFDWQIKASLAASVAFMLGTTLYFYLHQNQGFFSFLLRLLQKLKIKKFSEQTFEHATQIDEHIAHYYKNHRTRFLLSILFQFSTRIFGVIEIYLAAYLLQAPLSWIGAILLASITAIMNMIFAFLPGTIGVLEGAYAGTFHLMSLDPATGTSVQIFRRIRTLIWSTLGFAYMGWRQRDKI